MPSVLGYSGAYCSTLCLASGACGAHKQPNHQRPSIQSNFFRGAQRHGTSSHSGHLTLSHEVEQPTPHSLGKSRESHQTTHGPACSPCISELHGSGTTSVPSLPVSHDTSVESRDTLQVEAGSLPETTRDIEGGSIQSNQNTASHLSTNRRRCLAAVVTVTAAVSPYLKDGGYDQVALAEGPTLSELKGTECNLLDTVRGLAALRDPRINHGLAITRPDRDRYGLCGLLPDALVDAETEMRRCLVALERISDPLQQYQHLVGLQQRDEASFYAILRSDLERWLPVVYTPTVGDACLSFSMLSPRPSGLYVSQGDSTPEQMEAVVAAWPEEDVKVAVITDGERVLGLGDLGANGMGIVAGKAMVYAACGGFAPAQVLPVAVDVGTNNEPLRQDDFYIGLRQPRLRDPEQYGRLMDLLVAALQRRYGRSLVVHWEDVGSRNSFDLLERYRGTAATFNDDIQCTAAVTLAGVLGALRLTRQPLTQQRFLLFGAGQANIGIADLLLYALTREGLSEAAALHRIWLLDSAGLIYEGREAPISRRKRKYARGGFERGLPKSPASLESCVRSLEPTTLIGAAGVKGAFTPEVIHAMAAANERPVILALSNPLSKCECTAAEALAITSGRAIFASGSAFPPVSVNGTTYETGFANNAFIFPGIALGTVDSKRSSIEPYSFYAAAQALANMVLPGDLDRGCIYPSVKRIPEAALQVARSLRQG
eukprot:jgi/Mesen1/4293/ME000022S03578